MNDPATSLCITPAVTIPRSEFHFRTSRSSGPGGQNVNKLETRVELRFNIAQSRSLSEDQKQVVLASLGSHIDGHGVVHVSSQKSRSQWENKQAVMERFAALLRSALRVKKKGMKTAPTRMSVQRRVEDKKRHGKKKSLRKASLNDE